VLLGTFIVVTHSLCSNDSKVTDCVFLHVSKIHLQSNLVCLQYSYYRSTLQWLAYFILACISLILSESTLKVTKDSTVYISFSIEFTI
jgi:hypothetical protein